MKCEHEYTQCDKCGISILGPKGYEEHMQQHDLAGFYYREPIEDRIAKGKYFSWEAPKGKCPICFSKSKVLYFDLETTGLDKHKNEIVEIAYVIEIDGNIKLSRDIWIAPQDQQSITQEALDVIGKTREELAKGIHPKKAYELFISDLSEFCEKFDTNDKYYPAGYNVSFDLDFLAEFFKKNKDFYLGSFINWKALDPLPIMRFLDFKGKVSLPNYKLETVCEHYGIKLKAHNALSDILATRQLMHRMLRTKSSHESD